jgi:hypothetical protein
MKLVPINKIKITTPIFQAKVLGALYEPYQNPLAICIYTTAKNKEAVFECM